jgi:nucleoside-diphosphate-sugar epimerase
MNGLTDWGSIYGKNFENQSVLITGGAGFIGSHLAVALVELGAKVTVLDDLSGGGDPAALPKQVQFVKGSILDQSLLKNCTDGRKWVFHEAALGSVPRSIEQPRAYHDANSVGTLNVLEAARQAGVFRVMFAASSSAYGDSVVLPKVETMAAAPLSPYAATKAAGEALLAAYAASYPLDTISLRYFNIFGPRQSADNAYAAVIAAFAKAFIAGRKPTIFGDGEQSRDFTYVDNVVHANLLAAQRETRLNGAIINVACAQRITVNQLATEMAKRLGCPQLTPIHAPPRAGDVKHSLADLTLARKLLEYKPIVDFGPGLDVTVQWYKQTMSPK